jgi:peptidyl-prolyl cis-trans isomerase SurA
MRRISTFAAALTLIATLAPASAVWAQNPFAAAITVNERVVSEYELTQRIRMLDAFGTTGDLEQIAREALIEDRLKQQEIDRVGMTLSPDALQAALTEFAGRADMSLDDFTQMLADNGVDPATLRDFVAVGLMWRDYVRARFSREVTITETDIDRALAQQGSISASVEVLLSEIIIAPPPEMMPRANEVAAEIAMLRSFDAFSDAARQVSALPSRENGGRLDWLPITNYPPQLRQVILDLDVGEVTTPISIPNAIALFQMRGIRESTRHDVTPALIDYAAYEMPNDAGTIADVINQIDRCDDLYGVARNQSAERLDRQTLPPADIASDIALELARLDPDEISTNLSRDNGATRVLVMLCQRLDGDQSAVDRDAVRGQIRSDRLTALAASFLEDLRAQAVISTP